MNLYEIISTKQQIESNFVQSPSLKKNQRFTQLEKHKIELLRVK